MIRVIQKTFLAIAAVVASAAISANAAELGPAVGETIPHQLNTDASPDNFDALKGENGMALFFCALPRLVPVL